MTGTIDPTLDQRQAAIQLMEWNRLLGADEIMPPTPKPRAREGVAEMPLVSGDTRPAAQPAAAKLPPESSPAVQGAAAGPKQPRPEKRQSKSSRKPDRDAAIRQAETLAGEAHDLPSLAAAIEQFEHCAFRQEATNMVFADGNPEACVMLIGEAPGQEEDRLGKPFVGKSGQLIDRMYGEIGLSRTGEDAASSLYITNVVNWRPEGNRQPSEAEIAMFKPFVLKHIALVGPRILILHGNPACSAILGRDGITRLRGKWVTHERIPLLPMFHPAFLLRNPRMKRLVWNDLLMIKTKIREMSCG